MKKYSESMRYGRVRLLKRADNGYWYAKYRLPDSECQLLLKEAERTGDLLIRDMIIVLADTGMRFGELAHLTVDALHWEHESPYIDIRARHG